MLNQCSSYFEAEKIETISELLGHKAASVVALFAALLMVRFLQQVFLHPHELIKQELAFVANIEELVAEVGVVVFKRKLASFFDQELDSLNA